MEDNKMDTDSIKLQMKYYPVSEKEIETAESELNTIFPGALKEFYNNVCFRVEAGRCALRGFFGGLGNELIKRKGCKR